VIPFYVPPLREIEEDIPLLAEHFSKEFSEAYGRRPKEFAPDAIEALRQYTWPGNVRELRNLVERIVIMNPQQRIERKNIPTLIARSNARGRGGFSTLQEARASYEREFIIKKLEEHQGNVSRAAEVLGLERSHLYRKMKSLGIPSRETP
jgi:two-component system nitrogen regulation response regulator NtrX